MTKMSAPFGFVLSFFLMVGTAWSQDKVASTIPDPDEVVVATVGEQKITLGQLQDAYAAQVQQPSSHKITPDSVLNNLIEREAAAAEAYKQKLDQDPFVKDRFKDLLQSTLVTKELGEQVSEIKVSDAEVERYYRDHKEYRTSHVLLRVQSVPSPDELKAAYAKIQTIYEEVKAKPDKFAEVARNHSQTANRDQGGDMGFLPAASMAAEYFEAIKGKNVGYISPPIRTQFGYHIIKVTGIKDYKEINRDLYKKILFDRKRDEMVDNYYKSLRKKTSVKVFKDKIKL